MYIYIYIHTYIYIACNACTRMHFVHLLRANHSTRALHIHTESIHQMRVYPCWHTFACSKLWYNQLCLPAFIMWHGSLFFSDPSLFIYSVFEPQSVFGKGTCLPSDMLGICTITRMLVFVLLGDLCTHTWTHIHALSLSGTKICACIRVCMYAYSVYIRPIRLTHKSYITC